MSDYIKDSTPILKELIYNETTVVEVQNNRKKGNLAITKIDALTKEKINASFILKDSNGRYVTSTNTNSPYICNANGFTTNRSNATVFKTSNGVLEINKLPTESYELEEVSTDTNYVLDSNKTTLDVNYNKTTNITVTNDHQLGNLIINKVDKEFNDIKVSDAKFILYNQELQQYVCGTSERISYTSDINNATIFKSDKNGIVDIKGLRTEKYTITEVGCDNSNYVFDSSAKNTTEVNIVYEKTQKETYTTITNQHKKGNIRVIKFNKDNFNEKIGAVKFILFNEELQQYVYADYNESMYNYSTFVENKNRATVFSTNANGIIEVKGLRTGDYKLIEVESNEFYKLGDPFSITVEEKKEGVFQYVSVSNELYKEPIIIHKVDELDNRIPVAGAKFEILDRNQKVLETVITDEKGYATTSEYAVRDNETLYIREIETNKYYILDGKLIEITLTKGEKTVEKTITNKPIMKKIKIIKVDKDNKEYKIAGARFNIINQFGEIVDTVTTDENGIAITKELRAGQTYKAVEIKTNEKFTLDEENNTAEITLNLEDKQDILDVTIENEAKKGQIKVIKIDKDNNEYKIAGVTFEIKDEDGNIVDTIVTNENGEAISKELPIYKNYIVYESKTLDNYILNETPQTVTLTENEITNITFENELRKGQIKVIKVDKDNNEIKLKDVEFNIYDEDSNLVDTIITDERGEAISKKLRIDKQYKIVESKTLSNYVLNDTPQIVTLKENEITNIIFENELIKGCIKITKISSNNNKYTADDKGTTLSDAKFGIYDENNNLVDTIITDENGIAISKELIKGIYYIKELESPNYYVLNDFVHCIEIVNNKEIIDVTVENDSVDIDIEVEKRGFKETQSNDTIYYDFSNIHNKSNIALDNFTWSDKLPINALRANRIYTGTWNEDLNYSIWYKTNLSDDYIMLKDGLSTLVNNEVKFTDVKLKEGEIITDFEFRFGIVKADFREIEQPRLYCDMLDNLSNGFVFVNHTKVHGNYMDIYVEDEDSWTTITYNKEIQLEKLPKTGM